jgi:osmoprotectant transport system substrate-binding protein
MRLPVQDHRPTAVRAADGRPDIEHGLLGPHLGRAKEVVGLNTRDGQPPDPAVGAHEIGHEGNGPLSVAALKNGEVQVVELFSSDGNVVSNNFVALTDNKHLEGADYIVPVIRRSVDTAGVAKVLAAIDAKLTTTAISKLNLDVTSQQEQPAAVAQTWVNSVTG